MLLLEKYKQKKYEDGDMYVNNIAGAHSRSESMNNTVLSSIIC